MNLKVPASWCAFALIVTVSVAEETQPSSILKKVVSAYESLETYASEGTIIMEMDTGGMKMNSETSFSIKLKKPNSYLISWEQKSAAMPVNQSGAVWNEGNQPFLYMGIKKSYSKLGSDETALGAATGISGGAAMTIPALFLPVLKKQITPFSRLVDPKLEGHEQIENEDCYVISGSSTISKKETFWISKASFLIRKVSRSFEPPAGGTKIPEMSEKDLESAIKATGQKVTEENKAATRNVLKQTQEVMKTAKLKGTSTELHRKVATPKLVEKDFAFQLPPGTVLKESLFGE